MARIRLNVSPKTTSHRTGWTALVTSSVRSCLSFCSSTRQNVTTREPSRRAPRTDRESRSAQMDGATGAADTAQPSSLVLNEVAASEGAEDVLEAGPLPLRGLQLIGSPDGSQPPEVHQSDPVAQRVRFLHVVGRQEHRRAVALLHVAHPGPHAVASHRVQSHRRLVEHEHRRPVDQGLGELQAAHHATGAGRRQAPGDVGPVSYTHLTLPTIYSV